jgi:hypothetical protein
MGIPACAIRLRSPILYQQIRGRGTRTAPHIDKKKFVIYDFFRNREYFNDSDTDIFPGTGGGHVSVSPPSIHKPVRDLIDNPAYWIVPDKYLDCCFWPFFYKEIKLILSK